MPTLNLILGDQLFADLSALPNAPIVMAEDGVLARHARYHSHKLVLTFSAMRHFASSLDERVQYSRIEEGRTIFEALDRQIQAAGATELHAYEPADRFFSAQLDAFVSARGIKLVLHDNPMFLTSKVDWEAYSTTHRRKRMAEFYVWQRRRLGILVDSQDQPLGGKWSFDTENRLRLPKAVQPPPVFPCPPDAITKEVCEMVQSEFPDYAGAPSDFGYPVDHPSSSEWLETFLENRMDRFGDFEDALPRSERVVFHGVLAPMMNVGLLTPAQIIERVMARHEERPIPMNSLEGFVRQVIGWREFIRGVDRDYESMNLPAGPFHHGRKLKPCWYDGTTGLPPLDQAIRRARDHGWCHHIERLMVIGSVMFMTEIDPEEANRWFMEMFVDATDWVMRPNVIGMSQFADGGYFATKPYLSGSNYILKMSDYPKGPWCDIWDGLYWRTIERNREFFAGNPRLATIARGAERMDSARRDRIFAAAEAFIEGSSTRASR